MISGSDAVDGSSPVSPTTITFSPDSRPTLATVPRRRRSSLTPSKPSLVMPDSTNKALRKDSLSSIASSSTLGERTGRRSSSYDTVISYSEDGYGSTGFQLLPLAFAIVPAAAGLVFTNGTQFATDVLLLGLCAYLLHWLVKFPW